MANLATYWRMKPVVLLAAPFMIWRPYYRPVGGWFYFFNYYLFGLNPAPYHLMLLAILLANVWLVYRLAKLAGAGEAAAWLAAMALCYHAGIHNLYFNTAFIYDALCCLFYLAALVCYIRVRAAGRMPGVRVTVAVLLLYLGALNSKEMAITFPIILLSYEWLYHPPQLRPRDLRGIWNWLRTEGRVPLLAVGLMLIFCYGRLVRPGGLMEVPAYRPVIAWNQIVDFQIRSFDDLLIRPERLEPRDVVKIWILLTWLAWRRKRPVLRWNWFWLLVTPIPIEVVPGRAGACLAIPYAGLAVFASVVFLDACRAAAQFLAGEPLFRWLRQNTLFAAAMVLGAFLWVRHNYELQWRYVVPGMRELGQPTWEMIRQLDALHPTIGRHAQVVFLNDPFEGYDMEFIAELWFRDRTVLVRLGRKFPVSAEDLARAARVFDYREGKLVELR